MAITNTKESGFETLIVDYLVNNNGYELGSNDDYNREYAIDTTRLFRFLADTQHKQLEQLGVNGNELKRTAFLNRLQGEIAKRGIIDVLRKGVKIYPANLIMFYQTPSEKNPAAKALFDKNIFSVTRQLQYSRDNTHLALDLCLFINGLPVITCELKNQLTKHDVEITTRMKLENKDSLSIRQPSRANQHAAQIYNTLQFKQSNPGMRKKSVVPHWRNATIVYH
ncbi:MAG: hypothetical protein LBG15_16565 [Dysgonamonadaceae bacterium]|jgi:type I restriction enzyme R subunit|nr:hypothetical protein [Dysgonamonadaceae bacterium]